MNLNTKSDRPSSRHPNHKLHNNLVYAALDSHLTELSPLITGDVLDLGCGEMPYREWMLRFCKTYTGIDWSSTPHKLRADVVADLNRPIPLEADIADTIVSISTLEHLNNPANLLNESYRLLRPGGVLVLQVPFMWHVHEAPFDYFRFTQYGLRKLAEDANFSQIEIRIMSGVWTTVALKVNYQIRRLVRGPTAYRIIANFFAHCSYYIINILGDFADKLWKSDGESIGYILVARKP